MEHQDLRGGLLGVVVPGLVGAVGDGSVEVVESHENHVHVKVVENLVLWAEGSGIHDSQRIVHHLFRVERHPESQHDAELLLVSVETPSESVGLCPAGEGGEGELLVEPGSLLVVLMVVKVGSQGSGLVSRLVSSSHQVGEPLNPLGLGIQSPQVRLHLLPEQVDVLAAGSPVTSPGLLLQLDQSEARLGETAGLMLPRPEC